MGTLSITGFDWIPVWLLVVAMIWSIIWKAVALWKSARNNQKIWFIVMLVVNTLGLLEILYLLLWQKKSVARKAKAKPKKRK